MMTLTLQVTRAFRTSACQHGKKSRIPFDQRFEVTGKHADRKKRAHDQVQQIIARHNVQPSGILSQKTGRFNNVPEMIPEFIVPDLTDCELKPYVSYKVPDVVQSKFTAKDLFDVYYAPKIIQEHKTKKLDQ